MGRGQTGLTPPVWRAIVSSTRSAYCTEWNGAVGSGFSATVSPYQVVTACPTTIAIKRPIRSAC